MNQYGASQNTPYSGQQQDADLVNNPRYQGQAGGTIPLGHDGRGPQDESRYGAVPLSTNTGQGGYGDGVPRQQQHGGVVDKIKDAVGMGPKTGDGHQGGGYGQSQAAGYDQGQGGYEQQPRREGIVDKAKDAVGMGPNTGYNQGYGQGQAGYDQPRQGGPNTGNTHGYGVGQAGYDQQPRQGGIVDKAKDAVGMGPNTGNTQGYGQSQAAGYDQQPRREGAAGMGPNTGRAYDSTPGGTHTGTGEFNPNVNHPNEERGFGGGLGYDQSKELGDGYHTGMATGADAYGQQQQQPRREGVADKAGMGPNSGYDARTQTGNDAYVHGNHPPGMQDRIQGVNEPTMLGGNHGVQAGVGRHDGVLGKGEHVPESMLGERRTELGYDASKGQVASHLPGHEGHHQKLGGTGLGSDTTNVDYDERRGKGHQDSKIGMGTDTCDGSDKIGTRADSYDASRAGTGISHDDTDVNYGSSAAPPKKGLMTKIKEKLHH